VGDQVLGEIANSIAIAEMHLRSATRKLAGRRDPEAEELLKIHAELRAVHTRLFKRSLEARGYVRDP
jgi:hypothetical protein